MKKKKNGSELNQVQIAYMDFEILISTNYKLTICRKFLKRHIFKARDDDVRKEIMSK